MLSLSLACAPKTTVPIGHHEHPRAAVDAERPRALLFMLPGRDDTGEDFAAHGFVDAALRSSFDVDVVTVDAHFESWTPHPHPSWDEGVWAWIKRTDTPIYLGYGTEDFGARAHALLAKGLPKDHVFTRAGEHTWSTWEPLFDEILAARPGDQASSRPAKK